EQFSFIVHLYLYWSTIKEFVRPSTSPSPVSPWSVLRVAAHGMAFQKRRKSQRGEAALLHSLSPTNPCGGDVTSKQPVFFRAACKCLRALGLGYSCDAPTIPCTLNLIMRAAPARSAEPEPEPEPSNSHRTRRRRAAQGGRRPLTVPPRRSKPTHRIDPPTPPKTSTRHRDVMQNSGRVQRAYHGGSQRPAAIEILHAHEQLILRASHFPSQAQASRSSRLAA
ncbi:hypothetical protein EVG20_g10757, partial [Dentipellis fragilis]